MAHTNTWFPSCPSNMQLGCLSVDPGRILFINPQYSYLSLVFRQCTTLLLYFDICLSVVNNLLKTHIYTYFMYIGPGESNICSYKRVQHTRSIMYIYRNQHLCHPCKTTPIHAMMTVQLYISSHSHKNQCLLEEDRSGKYLFGSTCTMAEKNLANKSKIPAKTWIDL